MLPANSGHALRLWQLISPALPVGAYSYSQGLETAAESAWIRDESGAAEWIGGLLRHSVGTLDVPVFARLYRAWQARDMAEATRWNEFLQAARGTAELLAEDRQMGAALARVLAELGIAAPLATSSFAALFARASVEWQIPLAEAAQGYCWAWCENQVAAAIKLIPLGQSAGQRILFSLGGRIPALVAEGLDLADEDISSSAPALGIASSWHETQYSRLFRS